MLGTILADDFFFYIIISRFEIGEKEFLRFFEKKKLW